MIWTSHNGGSLDHLGFIPNFLDEDDPRSARKQLDTSYAHGGGWRPFKGFEMLENGDMEYPGDPVTKMLWETTFRDETIRVYEHAWIAIVSGETFEVTRMD